MASTITDKNQQLMASESPPQADVSILDTLFRRNLAGIWVLFAIVILFGLLTPDTFLTRLTLQTILSDSAITALMALGVMFPLLTGVFDISIAWIAGFSMVLASSLNANHGFGTAEVCVIALAGCAGFGGLSAVFVTKLRVNAIVATLGVGTVALGITEYIAGGNTITPQFSDGFTQFGRGVIGGIPLPFIYVVVAAAAMYYVLEHTALGRRLRAIGGNPVAARLAGIRVDRLTVGVLIMSALLSGCAGLVLATQLGTATDSTAPAYLLPAAAAVFLGATQIKEGVNPWGTLLAVLLLATGIKGLQLLGASPWVGDFFNGAVLLNAVAISGKGIERLIH